MAQEGEKKISTRSDQLNLNTHTHTTTTPHKNKNGRAGGGGAAVSGSTVPERVVPVRRVLPAEDVASAAWSRLRRRQADAASNAFKLRTIEGAAS